MPTRCICVCHVIVILIVFISLTNINGLVTEIRTHCFLIYSVNFSFRSVSKASTKVFEQPSVPQEACISAYRPYATPFCLRLVVPYRAECNLCCLFQEQGVLSVQNVPDSNVDSQILLLYGFCSYIRCLRNT